MIQHTRHSKVMDLHPLDNLGNVRKWTFKHKLIEFTLYELPCNKEFIWNYADRLRVKCGFVMTGNRKHIVLHG